MSEPLVARIAEFNNPLGGDLQFHSLTASDQLGRLFQFEYELSSTNRDIKLGDLLGKTMMVCVESGGHKRYFHGYINRFSTIRSEERYDVYHASVVPWLWFLTRTSDSRIFQNKTVPDIIKQVCKDNGFTDISDSGLSRTYRTWEYCVQYRETDFNFVSRLMEQEGIYYFFKHEAGKHTLVMADSGAAHSTVSGSEKVPYFPPANAGQRERDHLSSWSCSKQIMPGAFVVNDYNFETPQADLKAKLTWSAAHAKDDLEIYDYPGEYTKKAEGDAYVRARLEELAADHEQFNGSGDVVGLPAGVLFTLTDYPRADLNRKYLVVASEYRLDGGNQWEGDSTSGVADVNCSIRAIDSARPYRPQRITPKPVVQGPQTAVVVGPAGEEIYPDKYGRVKVQFFWDRLGKRDENSSCWIRVAHVWAGKQWGGIHIPRIKMEVIVEFLEGDPDQPIITGAVYNADNMPPYALPDNKTQSGIKSRSSKDAGAENFNEIRFEDKKGEEQVFIHAEKNQDIEVEHDETHWVGNDRRKNVDHDENVTIGNNRTEDVGKNESITIGENRTESVGKDETISIGQNRTEDVGKDETVTISNNRDHTISKNATLTVGQDHSESVGKNSTLDVGKNYSINAGDQITLVTGSASITMKKNGDITIKGNNITIEGSGKVNVKASSDITMKGSSIKQN